LQNPRMAKSKSSKDPRIDAYIAGAAPFAKPILQHLRKLVHAGCPDVEETIKWQNPSFSFKGLLCGMAAFKEHCAFGFWKHELVVGDAGSRDAMGSLGRITSLDDLPTDATLIGYVKKAAALNENGVKVERKASSPKPPVRVPADLAAALKKHPRARKQFDAFSPSHRREYVEWITEAKTEATREKRLGTAIEWIAEGKGRHWKYEPGARRETPVTAGPSPSVPPAAGRRGRSSSTPR
jgi:uncharacterized protein YdeI (YjbR/CyaY-like superfamily)